MVLTSKSEQKIFFKKRRERQSEKIRRISVRNLIFFSSLQKKKKNSKLCASLIFQVLSCPITVFWGKGDEFYFFKEGARAIQSQLLKEVSSIRNETTRPDIRQVLAWDLTGAETWVGISVVRLGRGSLKYLLRNHFFCRFYVMKNFASPTGLETVGHTLVQSR